MSSQNRSANWALMALLAFLVSMAAACGGPETEGVKVKPVTSVTSSSSSSSTSSGTGGTTTTTSSSTTTTSATSTTTSTTTTSSSGGGEGGAGGQGGAGTGGDPGTGGAGGQGGAPPVVICGDGVRVDPEVCDDGNAVNGDGCDSNCVWTACGNGMQVPTEQCDDGNTVDGDGCDSNCTFTACGNAVITAGEACDDGNAVDNDGCTNGCDLPSCGDNIVQVGEQCDDGNVVDGDGCSAACQNAPVSLSCNAPVADAAFDLFKIGGQSVQFMSGIWGTDASNVYIAAATYGQGAIAHRTGGLAWVDEPLPTSSPNQASQQPSALNGIHGIDDDNVCAVGQANFAGYMACRSAGTWGLDIKAESLAKNLRSVWVADSIHTWIIGNTAAQSAAWLKTGANWAAQSFPSGPLGIDPAACNFRQIWGLDSGDVFIVGDQDGVGILLRFNGSSWVRVQTVPNTATTLNGVAGRSTSDLYVSGQDTTGHGVIYHVTNNLTVWTPFMNAAVDSYGAVVSPKPQAAVTIGMTASVIGSTQMAAVAQVDTVQLLDPTAYGAGGMWTDPSTGKVYMGTFGRLFEATCN